MSGGPVVVQLNWEDPITGKSHYSSLQVPIAIGREAAKMPTQWGSQTVSHLELDHKQVSRHHAFINIVNRQLHIADKSANGTFLNGRLVRQDGQVFTPKDTLRIGPFKITAAIVNEGDTITTELNREHSHLVKAEGEANPSAILIWLVGGVILLLIGVGIWVAARTLLNQARPTLDPASSESSLDISDIGVGAVETITTTA